MKGTKRSLSSRLLHRVCVVLYFSLLGVVRKTMCVRFSLASGAQNCMRDAACPPCHVLAARAVVIWMCFSPRGWGVRGFRSGGLVVQTEGDAHCDTHAHQHPQGLDSRNVMCSFLRVVGAGGGCVLKCTGQGRNAIATALLNGGVQSRPHFSMQECSPECVSRPRVCLALRTSKPKCTLRTQSHWSTAKPRC